MPGTPPPKPPPPPTNRTVVIALSANGSFGGEAGPRPARGEAAPRRQDSCWADAAAAEDEEEAAAAGPSTPSASSTTNAVGTALVFVLPASRLARWLWARRAQVAGLAVGAAAGGPGVAGRGLARLAAASLAACVVGWKPVQALALVGCVPAEAGLQVRKEGAWRVGVEGRGGGRGGMR